MLVASVFMCQRQKARYHLLHTLSVPLFTKKFGYNKDNFVGEIKTILVVEMITFSHIMPVFNDKVPFFSYYIINFNILLQK